MEISSNYSKYLTKNPIKRRMLNNFLQKIATTISEKEFARLADIGCGEGLVINYLATNSLINPIIATGVDLSAEALRQAKKRNPSSKFIRANAMDLPLEDCSYELVISLEMMEHIQPPDNALKELLRVTKDRLIISVPDEPLFSYLRMLSGQDVAKLGKHPEHVNFWNRQTLADFLRKRAKGFTVKVDTSTPWLIATLVRK